MEGVQQVASDAFPMARHPSSGYVPAEYTETGPLTESSGGVITAPSDGSNPPEGNVYGQILSSVEQDAGQYVASEPKPENGNIRASKSIIEHENAAEMPTNSVGYEAAGVPNHTVIYDSTNANANEMGSYESSGVIGNGIASSEEIVTATEQHPDVVNSAEEERLWSLVRANCLDFNAWTALIEETERVAEINILKIRKVYDAFLAEFPLCFGYWKKYADHEGRLDSVDKVVEVYERAVQAVTYSVDIWLHYCMFAISTYDDPDIVRRIFERGLAFVGTDYLSYPLWDEYIRFEEAHQSWGFLALLYTRILENPIQQLDRYFICFKELATSRPLSDIRTHEEAILMAEADAQNREGKVGPDSVEQSAQPMTAGLTEAEELEKYIAAREEVYNNAKEFESKIINFETAIRRPYFHVRPLDDPELENWHNYLDVIEKEHDISKVIKLYERCLIACANYPEFWIRYVICMEGSGNMELAYNALSRATLVFVKKQPEVHIFAAKFKELNGDIMGARTEYQYIYSEVSPCLLEAIIKHANMEYRLGDKEAAYSIYEKSIAAEQEKEQSHILPMLLVQYSRFLYLVAGNLEKAREVLLGATDRLQLSKPLLEAVIHLETIQPQAKRVGYLDSLVEKFISPNSENPNIASTNDREDISSIFLEFLDLFGDVQSIKKVESRHARIFLRQKSSIVSRKRRAEDPLTSDRTKTSKASTDAASSPSHSAVGAYPNAQNQWAAGYGQRAPSWPQNSQVQGQQWNPAYAPQAAYSAYGYANYAQPQVPAPTSAPQAAGYNAYPPAYPAQAYPQQSYAQPAAAVATVPPQQASATQPYYSGYAAY